MAFVFLLFVFSTFGNLLLGSFAHWASPLEAAGKMSAMDLGQIAADAKNIARKELVRRGSFAFKEEAWLASRNARVSGKACEPCAEKYYHESCPLGWEDHPMDDACIAPESYEGACAHAQSFRGASQTEKQEAEGACDFCWPCAKAAAGRAGAGECRRDFAEPCPLGYSAREIPFDTFAEVAAMSCIADAGYSGPCATVVRAFQEVPQKLDFADKCGVAWPCARECGPPAVSEACPQDWVHLGEGLCAAPASYKISGCELLYDMRGWTPSRKITFAEECAVRWPCEQISGSGSCHVLDTSACPLRWRKQGTVCTPPADQRGACSTPTELSAMDINERVEWGKRCAVQWPCMDPEDSDDIEPVGARANIAE